MSLTIRRMTLTFAAQRGAPERQARAALAALHRTAPEALARHLAQLCPPEDERVVIIPRLRFSLELQGEVSSESVAEHIAGAIEAGVAEALDRDAGAICYRDPVALLADWLRARLAGRVAHYGRFRRFRGLEHLPAGQAFRTYLTRQPDTAWSTLVALPPDVLNRAWRTLDDGDATCILDMAATLPDGEPHASDWAVVARELGTPGPLLPVIAALAASVRTMRTLGRCERWITGAAQAFARRYPGTSRIQGHIEGQRPLGRCHPDRAAKDSASHFDAAALPKALAEALSAEAAQGASATARHAPAVETPFAAFALFCAFPQLFDLSTVAINVEPPVHGVHPGNALAICLLDAITGADACGLLRDAAWRSLLAIPDHLPDDDLAQWADAQDAVWRGLANGEDGTRAATGDEIMKDFARHLPGFSEASPAFLRTNLLSAGGTVDTSEDPIRVSLTRPPLDIVLGMSGLADREVTLPDQRVVLLERAR